MKIAQVKTERDQIEQLSRKVLSEYVQDHKHLAQRLNLVRKEIVKNFEEGDLEEALRDQFDVLIEDLLWWF